MGHINGSSLERKPPAGESFIYVRRTMVYQKLNGQWKSISGQGTYVLPRYVGQ